MYSSLSISNSEIWCFLAGFGKDLRILVYDCIVTGKVTDVCKKHVSLFVVLAFLNSLNHENGDVKIFRQDGKIL